MVKSVQLLVAVIAFNVVIGALFVVSNYHIWNAVNPLDYTSPNWGPLNIAYVPRFFVDGEFILEQMIVVLVNYPFWLFWVTMIGNILFAIALQRTIKEMK
jgi:hypothetical protein